MAFWDYIFGGDLPEDLDVGSGPYIYVAIDGTKFGREFKQHFIRWPQQRKHLEALSEKYKSEGDLYVCPSLFKFQHAKTSSVLGSHVAWVDLDTDDKGREPVTAAQTPAAGLVVTSGSTGHQHRYWRLERFLAPPEVKLINKLLIAQLGADPSGCDPNQLLRVPNSLNHKYTPAKPVRLIIENSNAKLPVPELVEDEPIIHASMDIPVADILIRKQFTPLTKELLSQDTAVDRSRDLYHLAARLYEEGCDADEIYSLVTYADSKWGKFHRRDDKELRLHDIVSRVFSAGSRFSLLLDDEQDSRAKLIPLGWRSFREQSEPFEWVVEGLLLKQGLLYIMGDTGVGKSTLALNMVARLALKSETVVGFDVTATKDQKILYITQEMNGTQVGQFQTIMEKTLHPDVLDTLEDSVHFLHSPEKKIDTEEGRDFYEDIFSVGDYTGVVLDTVGASIASSLSKEEAVRPVVDWIDRIRAKYNIWVTVLAHPRKPQQGARKGDRIAEDLYGSRLLGDRADTSIFLSNGKNGTLVLSGLKTRFTGGNTVRYLKRTGSLWFEAVGSIGTGGGVGNRNPTIVIDVDAEETENFNAPEHNEGDELP